MAQPSERELQRYAFGIFKESYSPTEQSGWVSERSRELGTDENPLTEVALKSVQASIEAFLQPVAQTIDGVLYHLIDGFIPDIAETKFDISLHGLLQRAINRCRSNPSPENDDAMYAVIDRKRRRLVTIVAGDPEFHPEVDVDFYSMTPQVSDA